MTFEKTFTFDIDKENLTITVTRSFDAHVEMGFQEGYTMGLDQLEETLVALPKQG